MLDENLDVIELLVTGPPCSGKTSLIERYLTGLSPWEPLPTAGIELSVARLSCEVGTDNYPFLVHIWDHAGGLPYYQVLNRLYPLVDGLLLVFDPGEDNPLPAMHAILKAAGKHEGHGTRVHAGLVSTMHDKHGTGWLEKVNIARFMIDHGISFYINTSARTGEHVDGAFVDLFKLVLEDRLFNGRIPAKKVTFSLYQVETAGEEMEPLKVWSWTGGET